MLDFVEQTFRQEVSSESALFSPFHNAGNRKHYFGNIVFARRLRDAALLPGSVPLRSDCVRCMHSRTAVLYGTGTVPFGVLSHCATSVRRLAFLQTTSS